MARIIPGNSESVLVPSTVSGTTHTLSNADNGKILLCTNGSAVTITVPAGLSRLNCVIAQMGAGTVSLSASSTTINGVTSTVGQYSQVTLATTATDTYIGSGSDADVAAIAALTGTGYLQRTGSNTWALADTFKETIWIPASAMRPSASGGCAPLAIVATTANQPDLAYLAFDQTTQEYAQFMLAMPKGWNESTVTFQPVWTHPSTTTNFGVVWDLQAVAQSDDDAIAAAYGTAQTSTDTGGTTNDRYIGPESSAITIAGTPAEGDVVQFRISRVTGNGSDTLNVDAYLEGIKLYITLNTLTDA